MSARSAQGNKLTLADKFSRLGRRMRDPEWRRYAKLVFAGKFAGIALVLLIIAVVSGVFFAHAYAADPEVKAADVVNPGEHGLDARRSFPGFWHAGWLHNARGRLLPLP
jgi:hypothetical protein